MESTYYGRLFLLERGAKQLLDGFQTHLVDYHSRIQSPSGEQHEKVRVTIHVLILGWLVGGVRCTGKSF